MTPLILSRKGSFFWNSISSFRPLFHSYSQFQIVSGENISFLFNGWDGLPLVFDHAGPLTLKDISLRQARGSTRTLLYVLLTLRQENAMEKIRNFTPIFGKDKLIWTISASSFFTVKSVYTILSQGGKIISRVTSLWRIKVTPSMRVFFFLLINNRILTHDNMQRRNLPHSMDMLCAPIAYKKQ